MTYLVITDNLIDNLDDLEINELKYEKIKSDEISNSTNVSLFSDNLYKFVTDEFFTFKKLEEINFMCIKDIVMKRNHIVIKLLRL